MVDVPGYDLSKTFALNWGTDGLYPACAVTGVTACTIRLDTTKQVTNTKAVHLCIQTLDLWQIKNIMPNDAIPAKMETIADYL
jgi:hypothetical protein